ncbi:MAG: hypothetical protein E6Q97_00260 [Desulfurellales bacterium]|nr:MAG: hypothetical protein E6Q97_00260 [Desulfurellales bacterium]
MNFQFIPSDVDAYIRQIYGNRRLLIEPQTYTAEFGALAANEVATRTIQISQQADFFAFGVSMSGDVEFSTSYNLISMMLTDAGSGRPFTAREILAANYAPVGWNWSFPFPRYLGGNTAVSVQLRAPNDTPIIHGVSLLGVQVRELI